MNNTTTNTNAQEEIATTPTTSFTKKDAKPLDGLVGIATSLINEIKGGVLASWLRGEAVAAYVAKNPDEFKAGGKFYSDKAQFNIAFAKIAVDGMTDEQKMLLSSGQIKGLGKRVLENYQVYLKFPAARHSDGTVTLPLDVTVNGITRGGGEEKSYADQLKAVLERGVTVPKGADAAPSDRATIVKLVLLWATNPSAADRLTPRQVSGIVKAATPMTSK